MNQTGFLFKVLLLYATAGLSGCGNDPVLPPTVKLDVNAHEVATYTLTIGDPGVNSRIEAKAIYYVANEDCVPSQHLGNVRLAPRKAVNISVRQFAEGKYRAEVLLHPFVSEDYYGLGVCKWALSSMSFSIYRSGHLQSASIGADKYGRRERRAALCLIEPKNDVDACTDPQSVGHNIRHLFFPVTIESTQDE